MRDFETVARRWDEVLSASTEPDGMAPGDPGYADEKSRLSAKRADEDREARMEVAEWVSENAMGRVTPRQADVLIDYAFEELHSYGDAGAIASKAAELADLFVAVSYVGRG